MHIMEKRRTYTRRRKKCRLKLKWIRMRGQDAWKKREERKGEDWGEQTLSISVPVQLLRRDCSARVRTHTHTCAHMHTQACTHTHTHSRQPILPMADTDSAMQREMKGGREGASEQAGRERKATRGGERSGMERREEEQRQRRHERGEWGRLERWEEERPSYENIRMKRQREGGGDVRGERQGRWTEWRVSPRDRGVLALCKCELCELKCEV